MNAPANVLTARYVFGRNLRHFRTVRRMTPAQLAGKAKMDRSFISVVGRGTVAASIDVIARIATAVDTPVDWFLMDLDVVEPSPQNMPPGRKPALKSLLTRATRRPDRAATANN